MRNLQELQRIVDALVNLGFWPTQLQRREGQFFFHGGAKELGIRVLEEEAYIFTKLRSKRRTLQCLFREGLPERRYGALLWEVEAIE